MWRQCGFKGLCHKDRNMCNFAVRPFAIGTAGNFVWGNTIICKDASVKSLEADLCMYQAWPSYAMFLDGHTFWNIEKIFSAIDRSVLDNQRKLNKLLSLELSFFMWK